MQLIRMVAATGMMAIMFLSDAEANPYQSQQHSIPLGASAAQDVWTEKDVKTSCEYQWKDRPHSLQGCLDRGRGKIGHVKSQGEIQDFEIMKEESESNGKSDTK